MNPTQPRKKIETKEIVLIGVFAALFVVTYFLLRIPVSDITSIHIANVFGMLAILLLGTKKGLVSVLIGVFFADILTGYPFFMVTMLLYAVKMGLSGLTFDRIKHKYSLTKAVVLSMVPGFLAYAVLNFIWKLILMTTKKTLSTAVLLATLTTESAALINMVVAMLVVPILYPILADILRISLPKRNEK